MRLMEQDQKIGIEVEFYGSRDLTEEVLSGHGLNVCGDASLGEDGVEVKFDGGVPIKDAMPRIEMMHRLVTNGTSVKTELVTTYDNQYLPSDVCNKLGMLECDEDYEFGNVGEREGTTGLHIHFAIPENYSFLDIVALSDYLKANDKTVRELSWRDSPVWAKNTKAHTDTLINTVADLNNYIIVGRAPKSWTSESTNEHDLPRIQLCCNKYMGMNITNLGSGIHTIEFRYADSALLADLTAFKKYLKFLTKAVQDHIIGRKEYEVDTKDSGRDIKNFTLKEVSKKKYENGLASFTYFDVMHEDKKLMRAYSLR